MVVLTINGKGTRFLKKGISQPKFMLPYQDDTIIETILSNIQIGFHEGVEVLIGLNKCYEDCLKFITDACGALELRCEVLLMEDSKGQADTVGIILEHFDRVDSPFWVVNCDTLVESAWDFCHSSREMVVEVFHSNSPNYSYIDDLNKVSQIAEKEVISNFASTGNYFFGSSELFLDLYRTTTYRGEAYISDVINEGIRQGFPVSGTIVDGGRVLVLGTPEQYDAIG